MTSISEKRLGNNNEIAGNQDTSFLKILALVLMLVDHIGASMFPSVTELRIIGRISFPLYAWCLVVGSVKTRSPLRYAFRLLVMAVISQPIYMMALNHTWKELNILFTLALALVVIEGIRMRWMGSQFWAPVLCCMALSALNVNYGWKGVLFIVLLYLARENRSGLFATFIAYALFWGTSSKAITNIFGFELPFDSLPGLGTVLSAFFRLQGMAWLALPLILIRTHSGIRLPKWLGYALYPLHLVVLILLRLMNGTDVSVFFRGF